MRLAVMRSPPNEPKHTITSPRINLTSSHITSQPSTSPRLKYHHQTISRLPHTNPLLGSGLLAGIFFLAYRLFAPETFAPALTRNYRYKYIQRLFLDVYLHTYIHTYRHTDIQTYGHTDIRTYRHTDIHIYIYTCMHLVWRSTV